MIRRDPLQQRRRQQKHLLTITIDKSLGHTEMIPNPPDVTELPDSHRAFRECAHRLQHARAATDAGLTGRRGDWSFALLYA